MKANEDSNKRRNQTRQSNRKKKPARTPTASKGYRQCESQNNGESTACSYNSQSSIRSHGDGSGIGPWSDEKEKHNYLYDYSLGSRAVVSDRINASSSQNSCSGNQQDYAQRSSSVDLSKAPSLEEENGMSSRYHEKQHVSKQYQVYHGSSRKPNASILPANAKKTGVQQSSASIRGLASANSSRRNSKSGVSSRPFKL